MVSGVTLRSPCLWFESAIASIVTPSVITVRVRVLVRIAQRYGHRRRGLFALHLRDDCQGWMNRTTGMLHPVVLFIQP